MRLNLGCGDKPKEGFLGVDRFPCAAAGLLCDFDRRLPFRDDCVEAAHLDNVIEHVGDVLALLTEISRPRRGSRVARAPSGRGRFRFPCPALSPPSAGISSPPR